MDEKKKVFLSISICFFFFPQQTKLITYYVVHQYIYTHTESPLDFTQTSSKIRWFCQITSQLTVFFNHAESTPLSSLALTQGSQNECQNHACSSFFFLGPQNHACSIEIEIVADEVLRNSRWAHQVDRPHDSWYNSTCKVGIEIFKLF